MDRHQLAFELASKALVEDVMARLQSSFVGRLLPQRTEKRRYLDTFDWRVHRSGGWLCEAPGRERVTLIWTDDGSPPVTASADREPAFAEELPPGPLREGLTPIVAPRRLFPVADVERWTRTLEILDDEGKVVCRVKAISDRLGGDGDPGTNRSSLVLEGVRGYDEELRTVERFLRYQLEGEPCRERELDGILSVLGGAAGCNPSALDVELSPGMTAGEAVRKILARLCDVIAANVDGVLHELDTEFLHDLRVAVRRSRSVLGQIEGVFARTAVEHYGTELRWLGELTGHARDLDVLLLRTPSLERMLPPEDAAHLEPLTELLRSDRAREQSRVVEGLEGERFRRLLVNWRSFLLERDSGARPKNAAKPVLEVSSQRIWKRYRKVRKLGRSIHHETPASRLHALRIECKKLRYLLEVFGSLYPRASIDKAIKGLKRLQNTLGDLNDCQVQARMLRGLAKRLEEEEPGALDAAVAIGVLVSRLRSRREEERERFFERFEVFAERENHRRFRELFAGDRGKK